MILGPVIFSALTGDATTRSLVGTRVYPELLPQETDGQGGTRVACPLPACVYLEVVDTPTTSLAGFTSGLSNARVQIDAYAKTYVSAQTVGEAIKDALKSFSSSQMTSVLLSKRAGYEDDTELHRVSLDFSMWSKGS